RLEDGVALRRQPPLRVGMVDEVRVVGRLGVVGVHGLHEREQREQHEGQPHVAAHPTPTSSHLARSRRFDYARAMRLVGIVVAVVLFGSTARADTPLPFEIVRMLPETNQALVLDRVHNTHVLLQPGSMFEDYVVIEISGLGMTVEKQQQRYLVYPHEAKYL